MKCYLVELSYLPGQDHRRVRAHHRNHVADLVRQGTVSFAGRFEDESGSVFLYRADTEERLHDVLNQDPYLVEKVAAVSSVREFVPGVAFGLGPREHYE